MSVVYKKYAYLAYNESAWRIVFFATRRCGAFMRFLVSK